MRYLLAAACLALGSCGATEPVEVKYEVSGSASAASLTIQNESGGTEQMTVPLPWSRTIRVAPGSFVYVSAQNQDDSGSIRCVITSGGTTVQEASSSGAYTIAGCSGTA